MTKPNDDRLPLAGVKPTDVDWQSEGDHASGGSCSIAKARANALEHFRNIEKMLESDVMIR